jgi:AhpD family alkylhydroperoxidase
VEPIREDVMDESRFRRFSRQRDDLNEVVMRYAGRNIKKFYNLDMHVYEEGALDVKTKELLGLVASFVLRCDDCILYHLGRLRELGLSDAELEEALGVGLIVGGSITVPHLRRALAAWDEER